MAKLQSECVVLGQFWHQRVWEEMYESLSIPGQGANSTLLWHLFCSDLAETRSTLNIWAGPGPQTS